jgi:iron complex transport system substrate-binding protein
MMPQKRLMLIGIGWLAAFAFFTAEAKAVTKSSMTVMDSLGTLVEISLPVKKVVALNSDCLEALRILKADNLVVGVYSDIIRMPSFWKNLTHLPKVGRWNELDVEHIVNLEPNLVIAYGYNPSRFLEDRLKSFGISLLRLDFYKIDTLEREVTVLGQLLDRTNEAARFCDWHTKKREAIQGKRQKAPIRPRVYLEGYTDYQTVGNDTGSHEMCVLAGGKNIAADSSIPYPHVTPEWVVSENPDVIVKAVSSVNGYDLDNAGFFNRLREGVRERNTWRHIAAVASGRVHVMDGAISTGPRAIIGVAYMCRWLHPDLFKQIDPETMHKEYLEQFQDIPYQGRFVSDDLHEGKK